MVITSILNLTHPHRLGPDYQPLGCQDKTAGEQDGHGEQEYHEH